MGRLFGTNGIRGIVNEGMNIELASSLGRAVGTWLDEGTVAIGTDTRLSNDMLKTAVASGLMSQGLNVVDLGEAPTPAIQYYTREKSDLGIAITASHNPPKYNGIKVIYGDGTELTSDNEEEIENIYFSGENKDPKWNFVGRLSKDDPLEMYHEAIIKKVGKKTIKDADLKVVVDCANGVGCYSTPYLLRDLGCEVITLNAQPDGTFPGHDSEPTEENLKDLRSVVIECGADLGIAHDGDADRAIFFDEKGQFLHGDQTLTLMAKRIVKRNGGGIVVTPVSSSSSVEDAVKQEGGKLIYTAVGSPIVAREMIKKNAVFGGEENGGLIFADHQYCRDAAMTAVRIVQAVAEDGPLSDQVAELPHYSLDKRGFPCPEEIKEDVMVELKDVFKESDVDDTDGLKIRYEEGWVLIRPSGTEAKYRIYSEAKHLEEAKQLGEEHASKVLKVIEKLKDHV